MKNLKKVCVFFMTIFIISITVGMGGEVVAAENRQAMIQETSGQLQKLCSAKEQTVPEVQEQNSDAIAKPISPAKPEDPNMENEASQELGEIKDPKVIDSPSGTLKGEQSKEDAQE